MRPHSGSASAHPTHLGRPLRLAAACSILLLPSATLAGQVREEADIDQAAIYHAAVEAAGERVREPNIPVATRMLPLQPDGTRRTAGVLSQPTRNRLASTGHRTVDLVGSLVCPLGWPGPLCELPRNLPHVVRLGGVERDGDHAVVVLAILERSDVERRPIRTRTYEVALTLADGDWTATEWTLIGGYEEEEPQPVRSQIATASSATPTQKSGRRSVRLAARPTACAPTEPSSRTSSSGASDSSASDASFSRTQSVNCAKS